MNTPNALSDPEINALVEAHGMEPGQPDRPTLEQRLKNPRRAPTPRRGHAVHFDSTIPLPWLLERLAELGMRTSNDLEGGLYVGMTAELRARFAAALNPEAEATRRAMLDAGLDR